MTSPTKTREETLRRSEERFRLLFDSAPLGIIQIDQNGRLTSANRRFAELAGYSQEELVGITHRAVAPPEDLPERDESAASLLSEQSDAPVSIERRLLRKDGSTIWVRQTGTMTGPTTGMPRTGIVVFEDISGRKQWEERLREAEETSHRSARQLQEVIDAASGLIFVKDLQGRYLMASRTFAQFCGVSREALIGKTDYDFSHRSKRTSTGRTTAPWLKPALRCKSRSRSSACRTW